VATKANGDLLTTSDVMAFNGDDPIGLFKSGVLIDIVGTLGGGATNFAINQTLVRKATITSPNTTYTVAEWNALATDDVSNLGSHSMTLTPTVTTWNGTSWSDEAPSAGIAVIINGNYTTTTHGDIVCANLTVNAGYTLTISASDSTLVG